MYWEKTTSLKKWSRQKNYVQTAENKNYVQEERKSENSEMDSLGVKPHAQTRSLQMKQGADPC